MSTYLDLLLVKIDEASLLHSIHLDPVIDHSNGSLSNLAGLYEELAPLSHGTFRGESGVIAANVRRGFEALKPSPGLKALVRLLEQRGPVLNTAA